MAAALLPLVYDTVSMANLCNGVFYAASLLVPYYLAAGLVRWIVQWLRGLAGRIAGPAPAATLQSFWPWSCCSRQRPRPRPQARRRSVRSVQPVAVPGDAIIVPYDVKSKTGVQDADHLLVPYDRYVELWNRAYPDKKIDAHPARCPTPCPAQTYSAVLEGEETLNVSGQMQINVLAEGYVVDSPRPPRRRVGPGRPGRQPARRSRRGIRIEPPMEAQGGCGLGAPKPAVAVPGDAIIVPYDVKSKTGIKTPIICWFPTIATSSFGTGPIRTRRSMPTPRPCPTPCPARPISAVLEGEETLNITGQMQIDVLAEAMSRFPSASAAACWPGPTWTANRPD